jgi:putative peptidoglycan lipid II flippase
MIRVTLTLVLGYLSALPLPLMLHIDRRWGVAGLTVSAGVAGWVEFLLLRYSLQKQIGVVPYSTTPILKLWSAALVAAAAGCGIKVGLPFHSPLLVGLCVLVPYGAIYWLLTYLIGVSRVS